MKLPGGEDAEVPREKVEGYLLSRTHPTGRFKARFFRGVGFESVEQLETALRRVAESGTVSSEMQTAYGMKYVVDGELETPRGTWVSIRTVWIRGHGTASPRFVTAYPG